ncbi:hypothetical protein LTR60_005325, partial [Cryomyces antarcticus]
SSTSTRGPLAATFHSLRDSKLGFTTLQTRKSMMSMTKASRTRILMISSAVSQARWRAVSPSRRSATRPLMKKSNRLYSPQDGGRLLPGMRMTDFLRTIARSLTLLRTGF